MTLQQNHDLWMDGDKHFSVEVFPQHKLKILNYEHITLLNYECLEI